MLEDMQVGERRSSSFMEPRLSTQAPSPVALLEPPPRSSVVDSGALSPVPERSPSKSGSRERRNTSSGSAPSVTEHTSYKLSPQDLVGRDIRIQGLGMGRVVAFRKELNPLKDSKHVVDMITGERREVVLRRRKAGKWNPGLHFTIITTIATGEPGGCGWGEKESRDRASEEVRPSKA